MLALNAIFMLVTQYGLEYPRFYERLYQLITPQAFAAKYRAQFFRLADLFLASGLCVGGGGNGGTLLRDRVGRGRG